MKVYLCNDSSLFVKYLHNLWSKEAKYLAIVLSQGRRHGIKSGGSKMLERTNELKNFITLGAMDPRHPPPRSRRPCVIPMGRNLLGNLKKKNSQPTSIDKLTMIHSNMDHKVPDDVLRM